MSKGGRIAGSTLSFIVGLIMGILVLIIGVASAAFFIASGVTVYKAQQMVGLDFIEPGSEWGDQTLWNFGKSIYQDYHNLGNLTINDLKKYGVKIPDEVEGIDLTALYDVAFKDMTKDMTGTLQKVLDGITLRTVAEKAGLDIESLPILRDNADKPVIKAINAIMGSIDSNKMTLRTLADNFNVSLGDSEIFKYLENAPLANFGNLINGLPLKVVINADMDYYVKSDVAYNVYKKVADEDKYIEIQKGHELDTFGGDKYIYDFSGEPGQLQYREFRYIKKTDGTYQVSYTPYASDWNPDEDDNTYYYSKTYVTYMSTMPQTDVYIRPIENYTTFDGTNYVFLEADYYPLTNIYTKTGSVFNPVIPTASTYTFASGTQYYYKDNDESASEVYGPDESPFTKETRLTNAGLGYIRIKKGTTEPLPQAIGNLTVNGINDMNSTLNSLRLGDVITVDSSTTRILQTLENTKIGGLSSAVDNLYLDEVIDIIYDTYAENTDGRYVQLSNGRFTLYNPADATHAGLVRYTKTTVGGKVDVGGGEMKDVSSQALQALGKSTVKNISDDFKTLAIGDVMDIDPNQYAPISGEDAKADTTGKTFYEYYDGVYYSLTQVEVDALADEATVYYISVAGTGNAIMRKLAYVAVDAMSGKISGVIDDTYLGEVIDIVYDDYVEDVNGVYVRDGKRYVLFNPAVHDSSLTKYKKVPVVDSSSQALQALGNTNIGQISSAFTSLTIGDVMDVTPNQYGTIPAVTAKADTSGVVYYRYDDGVYLSIDDWTGISDSTIVYYVDEQGTGNSILRKLAYVKIDDMASKLTPIVDDTLLSEIITINQYDELEESSTGDYYFVEHNANYTIKDTSGNEVYYAFVLDDKGSYYIDDSIYEVATTEQLGNATAGYYYYSVVPNGELQTVADKWWNGGPLAKLEAQDIIGDYYFYSETQHKYINSYMFSMYVLVKSANYANYSNSAFATTDPGISNIFYKRVNCGAGDPGAIPYQSYSGQNLWVQSRSSTASFVPYKTSDPNMDGKDIYFFYDSKYIASCEVRESAKFDNTIQLYTVGYDYVPTDTYEDGKYYFGFDPTVPLPYQPTDQLRFDDLKLAYGGSDFKLYVLTPTYTLLTDYQANWDAYVNTPLYVNVEGFYCRVSSDIPSSVLKYSKVYCDTVKFADDYSHAVGYIAKYNEIYASSVVKVENVKMSGATPITYKYATQKSSQVLCAFDKNNVRVGKLGDSLKTFTLGDVISVEPGSILDDETLLGAKLDEISSTLSDKLSGLTVGEVLVWANITTMNPNVKASIQELTLNDLFGSFTLDTSSWEIKVNMFKLFSPEQI